MMEDGQLFPTLSVWQGSHSHLLHQPGCSRLLMRWCLWRTQPTCEFIELSCMAVTHLRVLLCHSVTVMARNSIQDNGGGLTGPAATATGSTLSISGFVGSYCHIGTIRLHQINIPFHIPSLVTFQHKQAKTNTREVSVDPAALHNFEPHRSLHTS